MFRLTGTTAHVTKRRVKRVRGRSTPVLFENAHSQSNAVSFAVTILSGLTGSELCLFKNINQSVRSLD